uniref:Cytochrome P450 n=1 Tax=Panagrolaimus sp. JU765 TaxID=591449 RepID=A0AC34R960_9BILA
MSYVLADPELFPNPSEFKPERYLDDCGVFKPHPAVIPFGIGKRTCLGEGLARTELFLILANLFHQFEMKADPSHPVSQERVLGSTVQAPKFVCTIKKRKI